MSDKANPPQILGADGRTQEENEAAQEAHVDAATFARKRLSADILGLVPGSMKKDRHYRWVRNDSQAITKAKLYGYEVELSKGGVRTIVEQDRAGDGAIRRGDL